MSINNSPMRIVIAVCTRERPKMLEKQLNAILKLNSVMNLTTQIVIVENGPEQTSFDVVKRLTGEMSYHWEPRVGLTFARNTAIERCLDTEPDWIAFFDDDEVVDQNWLVEMAAAIDQFPKAKAFAGPVHRNVSGDATVWFPRFRNAKFNTGVKVRKASTGNILFHKSVYSENGANLRFDDRFNLTGGEDAFLFESMRRAGFPLLWVQGAFCLDEVPPERSTLGARFSRSVRDTHINGVIDQIFQGSVLGRLGNFALALKMLFHFGSYVMAAAVVVPFSRPRAQKYIAIAIHKLSIFVGYGIAIILPLKPVYQTVDGN